MTTIREKIAEIFKRELDLNTTDKDHKELADEVIALLVQELPAGKIKEDYHPNDPDNEWYEGYNAYKQALEERLR
jgi:hypothetical protein